MKNTDEGIVIFEHLEMRQHQGNVRKPFTGIGMRLFKVEVLRKQQAIAQQIPLVILIVATAVITVITWGHYGNIHIDFGRELYTAWRISEGDVLYKDIAWFNGPLSQYFNGLIFYLFGHSIDVLYVTNLIILIFVIVLIYNIVIELSDYIVAAVTVLFFLQASAFGYVTEVGNYNFIAPYSHEMSHGILLLLLSIFCLIRFFKRQNLKNAFICGVVVGLSVLTKLEVALANVVGAGVGFLIIIRRYSGVREKWRLSLIALLGMALPVLLAVLFFLLHMPFIAIIDNITIPLRLMMSSQVRNIPLYRFISGFYDLKDSLPIVMWSMIANVCFIAPLFFVKIFTLTKTKEKFWGMPLAILSVLIIIFMYISIGDVYKRYIALYFPSCWPIGLLASFIILCQKRYNKIRWHPVFIAMILCSFILTLKVLFKLIFSHYGVFFVVPSLMLFIIFIFSKIALSSVSNRCKAVYKIYIIVMLFIILFPLTKDTYAHVGVLNVDEYGYAGHRYVYFNKYDLATVNAIRFVKRSISKNETIAVLPQGAGVNFLTGHVNPTRFITILPLELAAFGEENILKAYIEHSPDWIVILQSMPDDLKSNAWKSFIGQLNKHKKQSYIPYFKGEGFVVAKKEPTS